jgi:hypothetical protein
MSERGETNNKKKGSLKREREPAESQPLSDERIELILKVRKSVKERDEARREGNYSRSDTLRERLDSQYNVEVIDQKDGPSGWKFKDGSSTKLPPGTKIPDTLQSLAEETSTKKKKRERDDDNDNTAKGTKSESAQVNKKQKTQTATPTSSSNSFINCCVMKFLFSLSYFFRKTLHDLLC